jgi:hypothetical protein
MKAERGVKHIENPSVASTEGSANEFAGCTVAAH